MTILVIEDEPPIREMLIEVLMDEGYPVESASNGRQALTFLRQSAELPRLILLDLMMPVMTGWQFRQEQLQDADLHDVPVIVLSASPDLRKHAAALQAIDCLDKPVDIGVLLDVVKHYYPTG